jgi:hypothetical protein
MAKKLTKTIVFGDIHGLDFWKKDVEQNPDADFIFLGDYLSPYSKIPNRILVDNLREIIKLKKSRPENVVLLLGNHDMNAITDEIADAGRYNHEICHIVSKLFEDNKDLFQYAYQKGRTVFTHGGITEAWFRDDFRGNPNKNIAEQLNNPTPKQRKTLYQCGRGRGGLYKNSRIFWADICELEEDPLENYWQIVGHSQVEEVITLKNRKKGTQVAFCDSMVKKGYLIKTFGKKKYSK